MNGKVPTCLYINKEALEAARRAGLNLSRVAERALIEAAARALLNTKRANKKLTDRKLLTNICAGTRL